MKFQYTPIYSDTKEQKYLVQISALNTRNEIRTLPYPQHLSSTLREAEHYAAIIVLLAWTAKLSPNLDVSIQFHLSLTLQPIDPAQFQRDVIAKTANTKPQKAKVVPALDVCKDPFWI